MPYKKRTGQTTTLYNHVALVTAALILPGIFWFLLGWTCFFLPLLLVILLCKYGWRYCNKLITHAVPLGLLGALLLQSFEMTLFSVFLIPTGYVIAFGAKNNSAPWFAGLLGTCAMVVAFGTWYSITMTGAEAGFFDTLNGSLRKGIDGALHYYASNDRLTAESYSAIEQTLLQMKTIAPLIMPAVMASLVLFINWTTVVLTNLLLPKWGCPPVWLEYKYWKLPDTFIWLMIASAILAIYPHEGTQLLGINLLLVSLVPYAFQGLAVAIYLFNAWGIPKYLRYCIYILIFLQTFGTVLVVILGICDVWFPLRNTNQTNSKIDNG